MNKDFRVQVPLWQISFILLFLLVAAIFTGEVSGFINEATSYSYSIQLYALEGFVMVLILPIYIMITVIYTYKISKYNKEHPSSKLSFWNSTPHEYLEDDEGWQLITRNATQKVYTFFSWSLPLSAVFHLLVPTSSLLIILNIAVLCFVQYIVYYVYVRRHVNTAED